MAGLVSQGGAWQLETGEQKRHDLLRPAQYFLLSPKIINAYYEQHFRDKYGIVQRINLLMLDICLIVQLPYCPALVPNLKSNVALAVNFI